MPEFLETIENIRAKEASPSRLFEDGLGRRAPSRSGRVNAKYQKSLVEAATLIGDVLAGRTDSYWLKEAMGTDDFPLLFGDILDRQVLGAYREAPATYQGYVRVRENIPDFRNVSRYAIDGADQVLTTVGEQDEYPQESVSEQRDQYRVAKRGRRVAFSWEAMINDDLDGLKDLPERLGRASKRSEEKFATELFATTAGPSTAIFSTANGNLLSSTATALSVANLQSVMELLGEQTDPQGEPILIEAAALVVPPALEVTAQNILNAVHIDATTAGGAGGQTIRAMNWMRNRLTLHVNRYLPIVSGAEHGNTDWYVFGVPSPGSRTALEMGFLRGHREPEIWIKSPNAMRVGGGGINPMEGDFDTDSIQYRIRHVFGGAALNNTGGFRTAAAAITTT